MLKLIKINKTEDFIEADYIPEDSKLVGHAKINLKTKERTVVKVEGFECMYPGMALAGLSRILNNINSNDSYEIPKEKIVMWY